MYTLSRLFLLLLSCGSGSGSGVCRPHIRSVALIISHICKTGPVCQAYKRRVVVVVVSVGPPLTDYTAELVCLVLELLNSSDSISLR